MSVSLFSLGHAQTQGRQVRRVTQQLASKGREEEDCRLVNMDVNNTGFEIRRKSALIGKERFHPSHCHTLCHKFKEVQ